MIRQSVPSRRQFLAQAAVAAAGLAAGPRVANAIEPMQRKGPPAMKLSVCAYSYRQYLTAKENPMTLEQFLEKAAELGLDGVELTSYYFRDTSVPALRRLRARAFQLGLDVSGTAVGSDFCFPAGPERDKQIANTKKWVDHSETLGAPLVRIFAGNKKKDQSDEEARRLIVEAIEECCAYAGERSIFLALENHGGPTATAEGTLALVRAVKSPWLTVNLDTGNFHSADPYAEIAAVAPYALTVHLKVEMSAAGKTQPADYKRIAQILRGVGYRGYLALEYEAKEDPLTAIPRHIDAIRAAVQGK